MTALKIVFALVLLGCFSHGINAVGDNALEPSNIRVCIGSLDNRDFYYPTFFDYYFAEKAYSNCTHVIGSVLLHSYNTRGKDLSFLNSIVEIGGALVIFGWWNRSPISFPNLTTISGNIPFVKSSKKLSLYIDENWMPREKTGIINLGSLSSIARHGIRISRNYGYCHLKFVDWNLLTTNESQEVNVHLRPCSGNAKCDASCPVVKGRRLCYGDQPNMCQFVPGCSRAKCGSRHCYKDAAGADQCCHSECAGGCRDSTRSGCFACKNFRRGNECHESCAEKLATQSQASNPDYVFKLGKMCLKQCPPRFLEEGFNCVRQCTPGKTYFSPGSRKCLPCKPNLPACKVCHQKILEEDLMAKKGRGNLVSNYVLYDSDAGEFRYTPRSVLKALINCTTYDGDIRITYNSSRSTGALEEHVREEDFENLRNLEHLNGQLSLQMEPYRKIKSLSFLSKLQSVQYTGFWGFLLKGYYLEYLGLTGLKTLDVERAAMMYVWHLCYMENFAERFPNMKIYGTISEANCKSKGKACDASCSSKGCWGPGPSMCVECKGQRVGGRCVA